MGKTLNFSDSNNYNKDTYLIIDGNSIMNRAFYGVMTSKMLSNKEGLFTNAIYGFLNIYFMIVEKINPTYVAVSFDLHAPTFRHKMYDLYKANRKGMPEELKVQMPYIKEVLTAMNIPIYEKEGFEADDILGTIAKINTSKDIFTYILTGDKDSFQLISKTTSVVIPITKFGKTEYSIYTPEFLKDTKNIDPNQVIEIKALMGDTSDNIPGVRGIGEKTAYSLIEKYKNIDNIYFNLDNNTLEVSKGVTQKLQQDKDMAYTSKTLATINQDVPLDIIYNKYNIKNINKEQLYILFKKLEFTKFMNKFDFSDIDISSVEIPISGYSNGNDTDNDNEMSSIKEDVLKPSKYIYMSVSDISSKTNIYMEYVKKLNNLKEDKITYFMNFLSSQDKSINKYIDNKIFSIYFNETNEIYVFDFGIDFNINNLDENIINFFNEFAKLNKIKLGYDIKKDIQIMFNNKINEINLFNYDLLIAYYLFDSNKSSYDIEYIFNKLYNIALSEYLTKEDLQTSFFDNLKDSNSDNSINNKLSEKHKQLLAIILKGIYYSYNLTLKKLEEEKLLPLYNNIEMPLVKTLASMESTGMYIDKESLEIYDNEVTKTILTIQEKIYKEAGEEFNINSTQQLGKILFKKLNLPTIKKNKTGYSTDKEVLEELIDKHQIIEYILEYRQLVKLKTTYVDGLRDKISNDGRIHTTFMQTVAATGRLSSVEPNLQNIPVRIEQGKKIRSFFATNDDFMIIDADYSQIELRILAHMSNDHTMIEAFLEDKDIHTVTASQVFNVNISDVTQEMRSKAKAVNFGIVYGISDYGLAKNIKSSVKEAGEYINNYLLKYNGIKDFMQNTVEIAKKQGYISTLFNRIRYIPELSNKNKNVQQFGKRIAMNTPIQGTAADIIKIAMNNVYEEFNKNNLKSKLIMQVHDELIVESPIQEVEIASKILKDCMQNVIKLSVPLKVDLNVGKSWYDAKG